jgi:hypothetical protein
MTDEHMTGRQPAERLPSSWQRLVALSGVAFAVLLLIAWFSNGAETPHYTAPDHDWASSPASWRSSRGRSPPASRGIAHCGLLTTYRRLLRRTRSGHDRPG